MPKIPDSYQRVNSNSHGTAKTVLPSGVHLPMPFLEMEKLYPSLLPVVVDNIARLGETVNVIAPSKIGKSWLMYDLALSIANGAEWLGTFATNPGKVLLVDNELHPNTLVYRVRKVASARKLSPANIEPYCVRGKSMDYGWLKTILQNHLRDRKYEAVIIDSHYRMLSEGVDENANGQMKDVYNLVDELAGLTKSAWFLVHHQSKGDQSQKDLIDIGSGAGVQSRAADTHLVFKEHQKSKSYIVDAAVRSFPPLVPIVVTFELPLWRLVGDVSPHKVATKRTKAKATNDLADKEKIQILLKGGKGMTANQIRGAVGVDRSRCLALLTEMVREGVLGKNSEIVSGNQADVYFLGD